MLLPLLPGMHEAPQPRPDRKRRGATAVEYLFVISLILVVCIATVQHLGDVVKGIFVTNADKTKVMDPSQK